MVADIVKRLPYETMTVGVFRDEAPQRVVDIANQIGLGAVQLHGMESIEDTQWIRSRTRRTIKAFPAGHRNIDRFPEYGAQKLLIDGANPGSGELFDWRLAEGVVDPTRLIVSGGLRPENVGAAIAHLHPCGVDVSSGVEAAPGVKDPGKLHEFIGAAHAAARRSCAEGGAVAATYAGDGGAGARAPPRRSGPVRLAGRRMTEQLDQVGGPPSGDHGLAGAVMGDPGPSGRFGKFGGRFVPESLVPACMELEAAFR